MPGKRPPSGAMEPIGYTVQEAADFLRSSKSTIYRLLATKQLRAVKVGAATLITSASLSECVATLPAYESNHELTRPRVIALAAKRKGM